MPVHNDCSALRFDPTKPCKLPDYFIELEYLLADAGIITDQDRKDYACHYINYDSTAMWKSIPTHKKTATYEEFKAAVKRWYPGANEDHIWTIADLDQLVGEYARTRIISVNELGAYH